jgi:hypothetical protein
MKDIAGWFERGKLQGSTHMIVVCDTYDYGHFPVYVMPGENPRQRVAEEAKKSLQRVMEVYSYQLPLEDQLNEHRAFNYD